MVESKASPEIDWRVKLRALKWFQMDKKWVVLQELMQMEREGFEVIITHMTVSDIVYRRWNNLGEGELFEVSLFQENRHEFANWTRVFAGFPFFLVFFLYTRT